MTLRLSGGDLRSRRIRVPRSATLRPTPGRVKEALFSIVGARIVGARVLDLFAGTGAIGFESLSRGAAHATFAEAHGPTVAVIRETAAELGLTGRVHVMGSLAEQAVQRLHGSFDFVYLDPPYSLPVPQAVLGRLRSIIDARAIVVYEHRSSVPSATFAGFVTEREARYGEVTLQFLRIDASF